MGLKRRVRDSTQASTDAVEVDAHAATSKPVAKVNPTLAALFTSSSGPVIIPERKSVTRITSVKNTENGPTGTVPNEEISSSSSGDVSTDESDGVTLGDAPPRKRRKVNKEDDLEAQYLNRLMEEEDKEQEQHQKSDNNREGEEENSDDGDSDDVASVLSDDTSASNDLPDLSPSPEPEDQPNAILHETQTDSLTTDASKLNRTIFISNVSTKAIKSKSARTALLTHLRSALPTSSSEKVESIRFRSTAYAQDAGPRKAAYAKKELMDETSRSSNAYVVLSSETAAKTIAAKLNGSIILDRHIHIDAFVKPWKTDHKRCIFVGNLPFVDEEVAAQSDNDEDADESSKKRKRPKAKEPSDAEEGLWRTFSKCGNVESVRVVRDKATRVGKGFAYVQFADENGVEKALLMDGKKFPPMLPRLLRVNRAKRMDRKKDLKSVNGRRDGGQKRAHATNGRRDSNKKGLNGVVFEGYRASSGKDRTKVKVKSRGGKMKKSASGGGGGGLKPTSRSSRRGAAFKAGGGKKKRDA